MISNSIHSLLLELKMSADNSLNANKQSEKIYNDFFEEAISKVIERYGEQYDLSISRIEIDLEKISKEDIPIAIEKALSAEIEKHIKKREQSNNSFNSLKFATTTDESEITDKLNSFIDYLDTGATPWQIESNSFSPKTYFSNIIVPILGNNSRLLSFFNKIRNNIVAVTRLNQIATYEQLKELETKIDEALNGENSTQKAIANVVNRENRPAKENDYIITTDSADEHNTLNDKKSIESNEHINNNINQIHLSSENSQRTKNNFDITNELLDEINNANATHTQKKINDNSSINITSYIEETSERVDREGYKEYNKFDSSTDYQQSNKSSKSQIEDKMKEDAMSIHEFENQPTQRDQTDLPKSDMPILEKTNINIALSDIQKVENLELLFNKAQTYSDFQSIRDNRIHTETAGLVLLNPFIFSFFQRLELLNEENKFKSVNEAMRAVNLLNYLAGELEPDKNQSLSLEKVMCGLDTNFPVDTDFEIRPNEKVEAENLLTSVCSHWKPLNNTSIYGLQKSFLQRHGTIEYNESMILIRVEGNTLDILMEDLPWGTSMFLFPWVKDMFYVEWQTAE